MERNPEEQENAKLAEVRAYTKRPEAPAAGFHEPFDGMGYLDDSAADGATVS